MATAIANPVQPAGAGASAGGRAAATCKDRTGDAAVRGCALFISRVLFCFPGPVAVQKPGTRASSRKGRTLNGGTRSLRAAALPFPPAFSLMPGRLFCPHGEELGETSHETEQEKQHVTAERQHHGFRI